MVQITAVAGELASVHNVIDERKKQKPRVYPKVTVRLSDELNEAVKEIIDNSSDITSPSQAIRQALVVYHTMFQQTQKGNTAGVMMKNGEFIPLFEDEGDANVSA